MIVHGIAVLSLSVVGAFGLWKAFLAESGPTFLIYLSIVLFAVAFIPVLIYRMYALQQARYILARDGISIYWGLRREEIPINRVSGVESVEQKGMATLQTIPTYTRCNSRRTISKGRENR